MRYNALIMSRPLRLFPGVALVGLFLCLGLWGLSYYKVSYWTGDPQTSIHLTQGSLILGYWLDDKPRPIGLMSRGLDSLGVLYWLPHYNRDPFHLQIPLWLPAAALLAAAWPAVRRLRRQLIENERLARRGLVTSLSFTALAATLWLASCFVQPAWKNTKSNWRVELGRGCLVLQTGDLSGASGPAPTTTTTAFAIPSSRSPDGTLTFGATPAAAPPAPPPAPWFPMPRARGNGIWSEVRLPFWAICAVGAASTLFFLSPSYRRKRRRRLGLCVRCAYDLRASAGCCPECGHADPVRHAAMLHAAHLVP
jgi:hypothetical protein